ncbi:YgaP-like transmembrane domain [Natrarchaeobaculum sulfurireducens]|uniref:Inner membrane protein YgaP-like transmembrane domain-containing protein n=1 Tax=Natrarchaeobaculum sulfurireducens TaxID=2044521 RepID=A0A346PHU8_9EURY|nr:YgaP-like transmembrane domain [Natrarchaeobaculum sulfurireducens]AXR79093.1 hypothetical protein AArc1_2781 [Natrarchaeobaculum sulfurireducens]AXR80891.1 hypothetical protein AArcMg_0870 [Natrarchaeobaculum sulfurireducens]
METNVCAIDRMVRLALGVVLAVVGAAALAGVLAVGTTVAAVALVVGLVLLGTATLQLCPLYTVLGIDTCGGN